MGGITERGSRCITHTVLTRDCLCCCKNLSPALGERAAAVRANGLGKLQKQQQRWFTERFIQANSSCHKLKSYLAAMAASKAMQVVAKLLARADCDAD